MYKGFGAHCITTASSGSPGVDLERGSGNVIWISYHATDGVVEVMKSTASRLHRALCVIDTTWSI